MTDDAASSAPRDPASDRSVPTPAPSQPRRRRRAVRPGAGDPDPSVGRRALDDQDVGWQPPGDSDDDRLRRDVPPHW